MSNIYKPLKFDKIASITSDNINYERAIRNTDDTTMLSDLMAIMCGVGHVIHITIH